MEYRSRRERREAERAGLEPAEVTPEVSNASVSDNASQDIESVFAEQKPFPSRRELRKQANQTLERTEEPTNLDSEEQSSPKETHHSEVSSSESVSEQTKQPDPATEIVATEEPLTAKSYIYQESSNTFTMDSIPDSLTATNGDLVATNSESIAVVTGSHPSMSSIMEDLKYDSADQKDTVAGKISLVDPVSAKLVAESREPEVVVPGKIVVRNRAVSVTFAILGGIMFVLAGIGLWWALSEMGPFSS